MATKKVTNALIRMYRMGTGDCFAIKFRNGRTVMHKMLIDAGVIKAGSWVGKYVEDLHDWFDGEIDVFAVTHEHADHVAAIEKGKELFKNDFNIKKIWLAWTENNDDAMAREWKEIMGKKKNALKFASDQLEEFVDKEFNKQHKNDFNLKKLEESAKIFSKSLKEFHQLHGATEVDSELAGMKILKEEIADNNIEYYEPGDIVEIDGVEGLKFYILGPPRDLKAIKKEKGKGDDEAYDHNKELDQDEFLSFALTDNSEMEVDDLPFGDKFVQRNSELESFKTWYNDPEHQWRRIDYDWLQSAGQMAMRLTSGINNLSLVMAMEFEETGKVLLFPGDAEIGSWESWHKIKWEEQGLPKDFTTDLLNRTAFYKVAHHLSHNGTAKKDGMEKMIHEDLVAMATLSYHKISSRWKTTMPNRMILKELIQRTQGRLIVTSMDDLFYDPEDTIPLQQKVDETRKAFKKDNKFFFKDFKNIEDEHKNPEDVLYYEFMIRD
jgi:hypothetical protein